MLRGVALVLTPFRRGKPANSLSNLRNSRSRVLTPFAVRRFDATARTDVNGGVPTRESLCAHDPALALLLRRTYVVV